VRLQLQRDGFALDVDCNCPASGITALFGPSGCGKTTCLRMAGLERAPGLGRVHGGVAKRWGARRPRIWRPAPARAGLCVSGGQPVRSPDVRGNIDYGLRRTPVAQGWWR
jgi:molybdate transport system ATP-binding protein